MNLIRHIVEPSRLLLCWQAPGEINRTRHLVGQLSRHSDPVVELQYLVDSEDFTAASKLGFEGYPAFPDLNRPHRDGVLDTFMRRLPPRSRADFGLYLEQLRLPANVDISDFALLGYSGAKLPGDGFSIVHPFEHADGPCEFVTEVAGTRHQADPRVEMLKVGGQVVFVAEPENLHDRLAIRVLADGRCLGYVGRGLLPAFHRWLSAGAVEARIERINGTPDRPRVFLFVEIRSPDLHRLAA